MRPDGDHTPGKYSCAVPAPDLFAFLHALRRSPREVGAIAPSSPQLAARLAAVVPAHEPCTVVELGAGTGVITTRLRDRITAGSRLLVVERDEHLAAQLADRCAEARIFHDDARNLRSLLRDADIPAVDAIVCGLPWSLFTMAERGELLTAIRGSLAPGGVFTTFAYVHTLGFPSARRFHVELQENFDEVLPTRAILRNLPPAITYVCRRPRA